MDLLSIFNNDLVVGFTGLSKNAGKTTAMNHYLEQLVDNHLQQVEVNFWNQIEANRWGQVKADPMELARMKLTIGITSIGYDGEELDLVTNLPKPRIHVEKGILVATAKTCLPGSTASFKILEDTQITSPMGNIILVKILSAGIIEVAGPSSLGQLSRVIDRLKVLGVNKILIDGAAGRHSFGMVCHGLVLSLGASLSNDYEQVIKIFKRQMDIFTLPLVGEGFARHIDNEGQAHESQAYESQVYESQGETYKYHLGALTSQHLTDYKDEAKKLRRPLNIIIDNPTVWFGDYKDLYRYRKKVGKIYVRKQLAIKAVTINPMNPHGAWFDKEDFLKSIRDNCQLPVFNLLDIDKSEVNQ